MPRERKIKYSFFLNEQLAELDPIARLLYIGLWTIADREGRLEDRPRRIKIEILPYEEADCNALLNVLAGAGFIVRYAVASSYFIQILNFTKHQSPHPKEACYGFPEVPEDWAPITPAAPATVAAPTKAKKKATEPKAAPSESRYNPYYQIFCEMFSEASGGVPYISKSGDFVQIATLSRKLTGENYELTLERWTQACTNYFASEIATRTLADLAARYSTFYAAKLDRFRSPVSHTTPKTSANDIAEKEATARMRERMTS